MRHQHECCRRQPGGATAIGRITPEKLTQAWVAEMLAQSIPECLHGRGAYQRADIREANALHQIKRGRALSRNEGTAQGTENIGAARAKGTVAACLCRPGEFANGIGGTRDIGEKIKPATSAPSVPRQNIGLLQR